MHVKKSRKRLPSKAVVRTAVIAVALATPSWTASGAIAGPPPAPAAISATSPTNAQQDALEQLPDVQNCQTSGPGIAQCQSQQVLAADGATALNGKAQVAGSLSAADLVSAYAIPRGLTTIPAKVAIVDAFDDPSAESDLAAYRAANGLPACTSATGCFRKLNQSGKTAPLPKADQGWDAEISLDLDMVSAACPACSIILVEADTAHNRDLDSAVGAAVTAGAKTVSLSWGNSEDAGELSREAAFSNLGVQFVAAAGDSGYGTLYPAASANVTAVGGTTLRTRSTYSVPRGWEENAWKSSGAGCSADVPKPVWQTDHGCKMRTMNDIAAVAENLGVYNSRQSKTKPWTVYNGTSASTPIIAGMYALTGTQAHSARSIYQTNRAVFDITKGNLKHSSHKTCPYDYLCKAGTGYDAPTGWGSPNGIDTLKPVVSKILIFGNADTGEDTSGVPNLTNALTAVGYAVTYSPTLPADVSGYSQVWWYGIDALTPAETAELVQFARNGGGLYLTGEWDGCCVTPDNDQSVASIFNRLVVTVGGIQYGSDTDDFTYGVNPDAIDDAATAPNKLSTFTGALVGGISPANIGSEHFLMTDRYQDGVIGLWDSDDVVGRGRLAVVMDVNWAQTRFGDMHTMPSVAQNLAAFLSGANGGPGQRQVRPFTPTPPSGPDTASPQLSASGGLIRK